MSTTISIGPQPGPQRAFLESQADCLIYGGAAGSGKSFGLLLECLRHINNPGFGAVIFRRTSPQITNPGGLWDESASLYSLLGARPNRGMLEWRFPAGARVAFRHLQYEHNVYDWQGAQLALIGFDELTHFTEKQFFYLLSRNRSTCGVRPYLRATTNPDAESWVARFIAWWIDQETGYPIPERSGVIRYFLRVDEEILWGETREELYPHLPPSVPEADREFAIKSFTFIPAKLDDNQILKQKDPGYLANLLAQPLVERERLLGGNWKIVPAGGKVFNRYWFEILDSPLPAGVWCRFWDFAATEKKLKGNDPDFTASVLMQHFDHTFTVLEAFEGQIGPAEVEKTFLDTSRREAALARALNIEYRVRWEIEPGSAGIRENDRLIRELAGLNAKGVLPRGDKLVRAREAAIQAEAGNVKLKKAEWNERYLTHLHHQPDFPHDDLMDATSGAFEELTGSGDSRVYATN